MYLTEKYDRTTLEIMSECKKIISKKMFSETFNYHRVDKSIVITGVDISTVFFFVSYRTFG